MSLVVGAGKDGVLYVLDKDTTKFGQGSDFKVLKQQPIFFTYFPGFGIDAARLAQPRPSLRGQDAPSSRKPGLLEQPGSRRHVVQLGRE